jgi:hypothetical protein
MSITPDTVHADSNTVYSILCKYWNIRRSLFDYFYPQMNQSIHA